LFEDEGKGKGGKEKGTQLNGTALYPAWGYVEELIVAMVRHRSFVDGRV
jgi:hypothetical protein